MNSNKAHKPTDIGQALRSAAALGLARLDAQLLLLHALGRAPGERVWLLAHGDASVTATEHQHYQALCQRRAAHEPLAYLVGAQDFYGLHLQLDARVLVPRADTETLVDWALQVLAEHAAQITQPAVLDLGTGSGAVALALARHCPTAQVTALDADADALAVAQANALRLQTPQQRPLRTIQGDWLCGHHGHYHLIASNPPYIAEHDPHLPALVHEPRRALVSGHDGLSDLRRIVQQAPAHLLPGGWLLLEHGYDQAPAVRDLLQAQGFVQVQSRKDLAGIERCSGGLWPT